MLQKSRCITLRTIRYKDSRSIVSCLSRELGRVSFAVNDGPGRGSARRRALMMPGSTFDCIVDIRPSRTIHTIRDVTPARLMIIDNPAKTAVILFICDFLNSIMRDEQPDTSLFDFIDSSIGMVVASQGSATNSAICFLIGMQRLMGISPDVSTYVEGRCLDMADGTFRDSPPLHGRYLDPVASRAAAALARMTPRNMSRFRLTRDQRREILDTILQYYSIHIGPITNLNSLDVLRSLFN